MAIRRMSDDIDRMTNDIINGTHIAAKPVMNVMSEITNKMKDVEKAEGTVKVYTKSGKTRKLKFKYG
jgi:hypothetical protein